MKLKVPYNKINPVSPEKDDTLIGLALGTIALGVIPRPDESREFVTYSADNDKLPLQIADLISSKGVIIEEFPLFIEINSKEDDNAFGDTDGDGNILSWEEWKLENHTFYEADGRIFIGTNAHTNEDMNWEDLSVVRNSLVLPQDLPVSITE